MFQASINLSGDSINHRPTRRLGLGAGRLQPPLSPHNPSSSPQFLRLETFRVARHSLPGFFGKDGMTGRSRKKAGMNDVWCYKIQLSLLFPYLSRKLLLPNYALLSDTVNVDGLGPMGAGDKISKNSATQSNSGALTVCSPSPYNSLNSRRCR